MKSPAEIKAVLDQYVIGQDRAKRTIATAVASHYLNVAYQGDVRIKKANVLLLGPTGSGKTFLVETVARILDVPFYGTTASAISPAGWVGESAETSVEQMYKRSKQRYGKERAFEKARTGIVYIDEIDKLALRPSRDGQPMAADAKFNTIQIQQSLLRVIEGIEVQVDGNPLDTSRILFVASGAFVGLDQIIRTRIAGGRFSRSMGPVNPLRDVITRDLVEYGLIPEFAGRFPVVTALDALTYEELVAIMRDAKDSLLQQKQAMLSVHGSTVEIDDQVLVLLARNALAQGTGARGVQALFEKLLEPYLFDLEPDTTLRITPSGVDKERRGVFSEDSDRSPSPAYAGEPVPPRSPPESTDITWPTERS